MQSWCPNKKALNSKLVSLEKGLLCLLWLVGLSVFPGGGRRGKAGGRVSVNHFHHHSLHFKINSRPGLEIDSISSISPFALAAAVCQTLQLETLEPLPPELPIGKKSLNFLRGFHTVCFSSRCVCQWIALFQEKLLCKSLHSWKIVKQVKLTQFCNNIEWTIDWNSK